jgi:hypothetical protein
MQEFHAKQAAAVERLLGHDLTQHRGELEAMARQAGLLQYELLYTGDHG